MQLHHTEETLTEQIAHWAGLLEWALRERDAGNQHMGGLIEGYANRRDSLQIQLMMLRSARLNNPD